MKMIIIRKIILCTMLLSMVVLLNNCSDGFIETKPLGSLAGESFWNNENDLAIATNGIYIASSEDQGARNTWWAVAGFPTNDIHANEDNGWQSMEKLDFNAGNFYFYDVWNTSYRGINRANAVIARAPQMKIDEEVKSRRIGEAKFLRGFYYFLLARAFGDVPLIVEEQDATSNQNVARTPVDQVWAQIVRDLTDAAAVLPTKWENAGQDLGRATKGAALGYLAFTNLYQQNWQGVITNSEQVKALGYALQDDYKNVFALSNDNNSESLFEIQFRDTQQGWGGARGHFLTPFSAPRGVGDKFATWGGWGAVLPSTKSLEAFEPGDERRPATIVTDGERFVPANADTFKMESKWNTYSKGIFVKWWAGVSPQKNNDHFSKNLPQLRYAEVLLNWAEALNEAGNTAEAYAKINEVRVRAGLAPKPIADQATCLQDIFKERRAETMFEFNFWFHLTRRNLAAKFLLENYEKTLPAHENLFPIPQQEMDNNSALKQNPGY